jgi:ketosteroid isomerase-like protein
VIRHTDPQYGPDARNRLAEAADPSADGAHAALETFYYALNHRDAEALSGDWSGHPLAQLNNPLGGVLRGGAAISELYAKIFEGAVRVEVVFGDVVEYLGPDHAVFAGRETGTYTLSDGAAVPLHIRTTRYFRYEEGSWRQFHHHGSIDDAQALGAYQEAVLRP